MSRKNKRKCLRKAACLILASAMCLAGCGKEQEQSLLLQEELLAYDKANYKTVQVGMGDYQKESTGDVSVFYPLRSELCWENGEVRLAECLVKEGQKVKQGDALMRFESEEDRVQLETLRIQLERSKEAFEEEDTKRLEELQAAKTKAEDLENEDLTIAEWKIEKQQAGYEQFRYQHEIEVRGIERQIAAIKEEAEADVLTAPYDGIVEDVARLHEGDQVYNGQWLLSMYSTDKVLFKAEKAADKLRYNMDVTIEVGALNARKSYSGKVVTAPAILPASLSQDLILIELDQEIEANLLKGSILFRGISEEVQDILMVERQAVHREGGKDYVYVLEGDMIQKRYVEIGLNSLEGVWILDGLEEGQTLIVD